MLAGNESTVDRIVRVVLGVILLALGLWPLGALTGAALGIVVAIVGAIALITGLTGFCLIYKLLGMSTKGK